MDLNDEVRVTLTTTGAEIINTYNREAAEQHPLAAKHFKHDYKEGDHYQSELHDMMYHFGGRHTCVGCDKPFMDLTLITSRS